jgi:hypothetical protein
MAITSDLTVGHLVITLLRGVISREDDDGKWHALLQAQGHVREYLKTIHIEVMIDEAQGYAYARQHSSNESEDEVMPRLIPRRQLRYPVSLLLVLLRKRLIAHDASSSDARLILTRMEIIELCRTFLTGSRGESKYIESIDKILEQIDGLGFIRKLPTRSDEADARFEVRRILKAFVDPQWATDFSAKLDVYRIHLQGGTASL